MNREAAREWTQRLHERWLPHARDGYSAYMGFLDRYCPPGGKVVDLGCGEEAFLCFLMERAGEVVGVDGRRLEGPYHRYVQADLERELPLEEGSLDLAACKFLLEHLERPGDMLVRMHKALRPGGHLVIMTPNVLYYPYTLNYLLSRLLPQKVRMRLVSLFSGRGGEDVFPVYYRCNTPRRLRRRLEEAGFRVVHLETYGDYLVSAVTRWLGFVAVMYEAAVHRLGIRSAGGFMVAVAEKEGVPEHGSG